MGQIGVKELVVLLIVVLIVFGAKRMPDIARSLGKSARILKSETQAMKAESAAASQTATASQTVTASEPQAEPEASPRTIQTAPGDAASARPVNDAAAEEPAAPKPAAQATSQA